MKYTKPFLCQPSKNLKEFNDFVPICYLLVFWSNSQRGRPLERGRLLERGRPLERGRLLERGRPLERGRLLERGV